MILICALRIRLVGNEIFIYNYKYCGGFPKHGLYDLVRGNSLSPCESGTHFTYVVCPSKHSRLGLVDGGNKEHGDGPSVHLFVGFRVDEEGIDVPRVGHGQPAEKSVDRTEAVGCVVLIQQCFDDDVWGGSIHGLVLV